MKDNIKISAVLTMILFAAIFTGFAEFPPWEVPEEASQVENPTEASKQNLEAGKAFYEMNCQACHGQEGLGDGVIPSGDMTTKAFADQTDGALFYKLQQGRGQMPSFRASAENDLWHVIHYIRTFAAPREEVIRKNATIVLEFEEDDSMRFTTARVYELLENGESTPAKEIRVNFYVQRYFADMRIGGIRNYTGEDGTVRISFPEGIPGEEGKLIVKAKVEDSEFNPAETSEEVAWGTVKGTYWNEDRQLWKNNDYVPLWLMVSFFGFLGGILLAIGYVLMLVMKIRKAGSY